VIVASTDLLALGGSCGALSSGKRPAPRTADQGIECGQTASLLSNQPVRRTSRAPQTVRPADGTRALRAMPSFRWPPTRFGGHRAGHHHMHSLRSVPGPGGVETNSQRGSRLIITAAGGRGTDLDAIRALLQVAHYITTGSVFRGHGPEISNRKEMVEPLKDLASCRSNSELGFGSCGRLTGELPRQTAQTSGGNPLLRSRIQPFSCPSAGKEFCRNGSGPAQPFCLSFELKRMALTSL